MAKTRPRIVSGRRGGRARASSEVGRRPPPHGPCKALQACWFLASACRIAIAVPGSRFRCSLFAACKTGPMLAPCAAQTRPFVAVSSARRNERCSHGDGAAAVTAPPPPPPAAAACRRRVAAAAAAPPAGAATSSLPGAPPPPEITGAPNVVVLGGTGRVGSSTAAALAAAVPAARISLAGRGGDGEAFRAAVGRRPELGAARPLRCDVDDPASLAAALKGADLVIHAAGPFQRRSDCAVLEAAIAAGVPYMDVCDDTEYSQRAKGLAGKAAAAGVPALTTTGIYPGAPWPRGGRLPRAAARAAVPAARSAARSHQRCHLRTLPPAGVSNVMAAHMISVNGKEYGEDGGYAAAAGEGAQRPQRVLYSYFTAGGWRVEVCFGAVRLRGEGAGSSSTPTSPPVRATAGVVCVCVGEVGGVRQAGCPYATRASPRVRRLGWVLCCGARNRPGGATARAMPLLVLGHRWVEGRVLVHGAG